MFSGVLVGTGSDGQVNDAIIGEDTPYGRHFIIGSLEENFVQEVYIASRGGLHYGPNASSWPGLATAGDYSNPGNARNPLGAANSTNSGNGTADPRYVAFRQYMSDGVIFQDVKKPAWSKKTIITQDVIVPGEIHSHMTIDASGIAMNMMAVHADITNTLDVAGTRGDFDMADLSGPGVDYSINAGMYTYAAGPGITVLAPYIYADGGYDVYDVDWSNYFDHFETNPWRFEGNKPTLE